MLNLQQNGKWSECSNFSYFLGESFYLNLKTNCFILEPENGTLNTILKSLQSVDCFSDKSKLNECDIELIKSTRVPVFDKSTDYFALVSSLNQRMKEL